MHLFWTDFIEPILEKISEKKKLEIVEIGSSTGANTKSILSFCARVGAFCHIIDPLDIGNESEIKGLLETNGKHHKTLSLNILDQLPNVDVYLIDGDHNWYTVFHELEAIWRMKIENRMTESYPVIFFHDVEWPYHRRDAYYDPAQIPPSFKQPSFPGGLVPNQSDLSHSEGINFGIDQACKEGGSKNGVLTAIEDFIEKYQILKAYEFYIVPGNSGLGCLFPKERFDGEILDYVRNRLTTPLHWAAYIHRLYDAHWATELTLSRKKMQYDELVKKYNQLVNNYGIYTKKSFEEFQQMERTYNEVLANHEQLKAQASTAFRKLERLNNSRIFRAALKVRRLFV